MWEYNGKNVNYKFEMRLWEDDFPFLFFLEYQLKFDRKEISVVASHLHCLWLSQTFLVLQILSGRRSKQRQSEFNLAVTLVSIVFMHILCNALRVFLGVLVVALVGESKLSNIKSYHFTALSCFSNESIVSDVQVECIRHADHYIPPLWIMCLESVAHLLVMFNFSSNFLIYCSVSNQFKSALSKVCRILCKRGWYKWLECLKF